MNDKTFVIKFFLSVAVGMVILTAVIWSIPSMDYFDGEYPSWQQQRDYTHEQGSESQIIFLGDSAFKAAVIPKMIDDSAYNLSLGGAGPIEMYYSLKNYLRNHPKPQKIFISFGPMHFIYLERYYDRTLYFHFLSPNEQIESQLNIFTLDDVPIYDRPMMLFENLQFMTKFPTKYFQTIKMSELKRGPLNKENYQQVASENGHMFFGLDSEWFNHYEPHEQLQVDFKLLHSEDFYMKKLIQMCLDNDIPVKIVQTPVNKLTYATASEHDYFPPYLEYLRSLSREFNIEVETELKMYDISLFGDHLHVNEEGAKIYTNEMKQKYNL